MMTFRQRLSTALALCGLSAAPLSGHAQQSELLPLPLDEVRMFTEALDRIRMAYVEEIDDKTLLENAIRGMLSGLDPHSAYMAGQEYDALQETTSGEFGGNCSILAGSHIGDNVTIGAGCVIHGQIPSNTLVLQDKANLKFVEKSGPYLWNSRKEQLT